MGQTLFSGAQKEKKGQRAQTGTQQVPFEHEKKSLIWGLQSTGKSCPERLCISSGNIQNPPGSFSVQPTVGNLLKQVSWT